MPSPEGVFPDFDLFSIINPLGAFVRISRKLKGITKETIQSGDFENNLRQGNMKDSSALQALIELRTYQADLQYFKAIYQSENDKNSISPEILEYYRNECSFLRRLYQGYNFLISPLGELVHEADRRNIAFHISYQFEKTRFGEGEGRDPKPLTYEGRANIRRLCRL